jgi:phosphoglycolate phosphatase-like HAD superfamily hydrolase
MAAQALIFDADGTLWDSLPHYAAAIAGDEPRLRARIESQLRRGASVVSLVRAYGVSERLFLDRLRHDGDDPLLYAGASAVIRALARRGTPLGIATSLPGRFVEPLLLYCGLAADIPVVVHAGNCRSRKPNPGPILITLQRLHLKPSPAIYYVGDRSDDAAAASRAGVSFAWASYGYDESQPSYCSAVLRDVAGVLEL